MPHTTEGPRGPVWVTNKGASLGLACGMGSAGREYIPGRIHRSDRMASTGLYEDGKRGIRRVTDPELRLKDQDRDGVQAEVLYRVLGTTGRMNDPEAAVEVLRIYNEWLADFCSTYPDRYAGLASIPNHPLEAAITEVERVVKRGAPRTRHRQLGGPETALGSLLEPALGRDRRLRAAAPFPHGRRLHARPHPQDHPHRRGSDARQRPRRAEGRAPGGALSIRVEHHPVPDEHVQHPHVDDLLGRVRALSADEARARRVRDRLDPLRPLAHGRRVGGSVQGPLAHDAAERVLEAAVLGDLSDRPHRREADRRAR